MNQSKISKHLKLASFSEANISCLYDEELIANFSIQMFDSAYWQNLDAVIGKATGRGTTWFVKHDNLKMVLRHYYRGGLIGKLINDSYLFFGVMNTRAAKEFVLLKEMNAFGLPAPRPIALKVERSGLTYKADILIELINGATDLVGLLSKSELPQKIWFEVGKCIKQFHDKNVYHHDLNAHNIMLDSDNKVWLIDFDQGCFKSGAGSWQQDNMARLQRSFLKEQKKLPVFHYSENNWQSLLEGYYSDTEY